MEPSILPGFLSELWVLAENTIWFTSRVQTRGSFVSEFDDLPIVHHTPPDWHAFKTGQKNKGRHSHDVANIKCKIDVLTSLKSSSKVLRIINQFFSEVRLY